MSRGGGDQRFAPMAYTVLVIFLPLTAAQSKGPARRAEERAQAARQRSSTAARTTPSVDRANRYDRASSR